MRLHQILPDLLYQSGHTQKTSVEACRQLIDFYKLDMIVSVWHSDQDRLEALIPGYVHVPLPDGKVTPMVAREVEALAARVVSNLYQRKPVLVHCHAGRNRSGLITALAVKSYLGVSGTEAINIVRLGRPRALANEHFVRYLTGEGP